MQYDTPPVGRLTTASITAFMMLVLTTFVVQRPIILVAGSLVCAAYALIVYREVHITNTHLLAFGVTCMLFIPAFIKPYHGLSPVFYFFSTVSVFLAAMAIARYPLRIFLTAFRFIFTCALIAIAWVLYTYWGHPEPFGEAIKGSSTNGIPAYLIVIQIGLSLTNYLARRQLPVLSPILTSAVAFFGNGRGSLVVAGLIIVASLMFNLVLIRSTNPWRRLAFVLSFIAIATALFWKGEEWLDLVIRYTKLSVGLVDVNRLEAWNHYTGKITPWTFLVGTDYLGTAIDYKLHGNPHIAYIRTHSFFGLFITLLAMASPLVVFFSRKILSAQLVFFCFIALAAMRAASEPLFFPTLLDFFYFLYLFLFFRYAPERPLGGRGDLVFPARIVQAR